MAVKAIERKQRLRGRILPAVLRAIFTGDKQDVG